MLKNWEKQKRHREKLYKAGLMQTIVWVRRKDNKADKKITYADFNKNFKKLTAGWDENDISMLLNTFINITKAKKDINKLKEKK